MIGRIRRWIARGVASMVMVLTLGRVTVAWDGVDPVSGDPGERPAITATDDHSR